MAKLIILTSEPNNWVPEELEKKAKAKGFDVEIVNPNTCFITLTDDPFISKNGEKFEQADIVIPRLSEDNLDYKVAIMNHLQKMDVKVLNSGKSMRTASNKVETQIILNDKGLKTPKTAVFTNEDQIDKAMEAIGNKFPVIVKTLFGTHGVGVVRADSRASLVSIIQQLVKLGEQFMLQEYIEHDESGRILLLGGEIIASVMRTIPDGDFRSNAHQGAELKKHDPSENEIEICKKAAEALDIEFAAVDYILVNDEVVLLEVNGSPGFEEMQKVVDDDIASIVIEYCAGMVDGMSAAKGEIEGENVKDPTQETIEPKSTQEEPVEEPEGIIEIPPHDVEGDKIVGTVTHVRIKHFNNDESIEARVDTGANLSSIHGENIEVNDNTVKFKFGDLTYKFYLVKTAKIKQSSIDDLDERPVIAVDMVIDGIELKNVQLTVTNREHMEYDILLGRQTLATAGLLVNPAVGNISNNDQETPLENNEPIIGEPEKSSKQEEE